MFPLWFVKYFPMIIDRSFVGGGFMVRVLYQFYANNLRTNVQPQPILYT